MKNQGRFKGLLPPIVISILLVGMFLTFLSNFDKRNESVIKDIQDGNAIVLSPDCDTIVLAEIIDNNGYADTLPDAVYIASVLKKRQKELGRLPSLYTLQKRAFGQVPADTVAQNGFLQQKLQASRKRLFQNVKVPQYCKDSFPDEWGGKIIVTVFEKKESENWWKKKLKIEDQVPCRVDTVVLITHYRDSLGKASFDTLGYLPMAPMVERHKKDTTYKAIFENLDINASYSVLPIKQGFEYGTSKGTVSGKWKMGKHNEGMEFSFEQKEHRIPLFSNTILGRIKSDRTILVRSPQEYKAIVVKWFVYVMLAWWVLCLYMIIRKKKFNSALLSSCMFLTGLCVLMMFSMQDPLNDELHGVTMAKGVVAGLAICLIFQSVDFVKFYQNNSKVGFDIPLNVFKWLFKPYRQKVVNLATKLKSEASIMKKMVAMVLVVITLPFLLLDLLQITRLSKFIDKLCEKMPKGLGWLVMALLLTALLWTPFGQSIGGMRVNLNLFGVKFQPSEIAKYFILFFMAAFFTQQADAIIAYSQPNRIKMIGDKVKTLLWVIFGLAVLMAMYLALGDMGPGLVLGITFILLYSLIKSKVNLERLDEEDRWKRIFTCDFAMLIYGVLSFIGFLFIGFRLEGKDSALLFGSLWFVFWIALGYLGFKKQLFESAILINAIIFVFIFGGHLMQQIPALKDSSAVERFNDRIEMCTNTWGDLDIEHFGDNANDVSNSQVANGLWALATGGMRGQGWGGGKPSLVPAFHTDMILSSIGEQLGWMGLLMVVIALAVLLRKMAVIGYRVGHPFAFYLCLGFAIVIGVQFFIIALGSSGMIPLTGVTVPFLSFGRVSMILNLAAFGIVLSLCNNVREDETAVSENVRQKTVEQYSYPIAMVTMVFLFFAISTLLVWQYYQLWKRNSTLIHPAYVINNQGAPVVEYNPRINLLVRNMYAGRIYDRKGKLLATSDRSEIKINSYDYEKMGFVKEKKNKAQITKEEQISKMNNMLKRNQRRYYPLGEQLFFMVGDINNGILFSYDEYHPAGYMAEAQHLSYLRGFDNVLYDKPRNDKSKKPVKVRLKTDRLIESTYLAPRVTVSDAILLRDYRELLPFLKNGIDGKLVDDHNKAVASGEFDLHLTIDAELQTDLQNRIANHVETYYSSNNLLRVSVVVLDAQNGDLLASANYPLPDYDRLAKEEELAHDSGKPYAIFNDYRKDKTWHTYTDRDLGTTYPTPPGSTAKVMSAMGGFRKLATSAQNEKYYISYDNIIERDPDEPHGHLVTMQEAIVKSSNCYFINLVNDKDLYNSLKPIYSSIGISIGGITPYVFTKKSDTTWKNAYDAKISINRDVALQNYDLFLQGRLVKNKKGEYLSKDNTYMGVGAWRWAWGQGYSDDTGESFDFLASPLNMARVASAVVNKGDMPITQYVLAKNDYEASLRNEGTIHLVNSKEAGILKGYMFDEATKHRKNGHNIPSFFGSKTGTPERERIIKSEMVYNKKLKRKEIKNTKVKLNDGWYMFFAESNDSSHHSIAVAVRMERLPKRSISSHAVKLTGDVVKGCLCRHGYIME